MIERWGIRARVTFVAFVPMLLGMVCHEVAHGWAAWKRGDPTAKMLGRLTLNPLPHLDVMGSLLLVTGVTCEFAMRATRTVFVRLAAVGAVLFIFVMVWGELATGFFRRLLAGN